MKTGRPQSIRPYNVPLCCGSQPYSPQHPALFLKKKIHTQSAERQPCARSTSLPVPPAPTACYTRLHLPFGEADEKRHHRSRAQTSQPPEHASHNLSSKQHSPPPTAPQTPRRHRRPQTCRHANSHDPRSRQRRNLTKRHDRADRDNFPRSRTSRPRAPSRPHSSPRATSQQPRPPPQQGRVQSPRRRLRPPSEGKRRPQAFRKHGLAGRDKREPQTPPLTVSTQSTQRPLGEAWPRRPAVSEPPCSAATTPTQNPQAVRLSSQLCITFANLLPR